MLKISLLVFVLLCSCEGSRSPEAMESDLTGIWFFSLRKFSGRVADRETLMGKMPLSPPLSLE
jgi:hypothetical protein